MHLEFLRGGGRSNEILGWKGKISVEPAPFSLGDSANLSSILFRVPVFMQCRVVFLVVLVTLEPLRWRLCS